MQQIESKVERTCPLPRRKLKKSRKSIMGSGNTSNFSGKVEGAKNNNFNKEALVTFEKYRFQKRSTGKLSKIWGKSGGEQGGSTHMAAEGGRKKSSLLPGQRHAPCAGGGVRGGTAGVGNGPYEAQSLGQTIL